MNNSATTTDEYLKNVPTWQAKNLVAFRKLVHEHCPDITEEIKWGVPVFILKKKMVFTMASFKNHTKYNFLLGAQLQDKTNTFNNGLESKSARSIDLLEGDKVDSKVLKDLVLQSITLAKGK